MFSDYVCYGVPEARENCIRRQGYVVWKKETEAETIV